MSLDIGLVVHYFDRSEGTGGYAVELATRFAREHRVTVYAAGIRSPVPDGVRVVHVPAFRGRAYATILSFPLAFAAVRKRHDIVHAQGWVANRADVVTAHIVLAAWLERARAAGVRSPAGERWLGGFVSRREATLYRWNARAVIAPSQQAKADIARLYGRSEGVHVVPHGFPRLVDVTPGPSAVRGDLTPAPSALVDLTPNPSPYGRGVSVMGHPSNPAPESALPGAKTGSLPEIPPLPEGEGPGVRSRDAQGEGPGVRSREIEGEGPGVRARFGIPANAFVALYVGDARKGLLTTLEAIAMTPGVHLLVLSGSPFTAYAPSIDRLGLVARVHWAGHLRDPGSAYSAVDALVHPTIYDTFALVIAEAMAHGLPVVVSRAAGASELLTHGESAWLLDTGSATEAAAGLAALMRDPSLRNRLGSGARAVAARRSWDIVALETIAVYRTLAPR